MPAKRWSGGAGDSEDIAIVKMQALKLAGWNPRDLYISIGREKGVGAHIVLLARTPMASTCSTTGPAGR